MDVDIRDFMNIQCVECMTHLRTPKVGDKFLTGNRMIAQKDLKTVGQEISWYEVVDVKPNGNISYATIYGRLKRSVEERDGDITSIRD